MFRSRTAWMLAVIAASAALLSAGAGKATAQVMVWEGPTAVSYYARPAVTYYAPPVVSYYAPPVVSYYAPPAVSYYAPPPVSYYPGPVTTTRRYGLFGRRQVTTTYYPGSYVYP